MKGPIIIFILSLTLLFPACVNKKSLHPEEQKLVGFWYHGIRPGAIGFFADKTYKEYLPSEGDEILEIDTGAVAIEGSWKLEKNQLTRWRKGEEKADIQKIVWENDSTFSFGPFDEKEFGSKDEFMDEHGMFRANQ